MLQVTIDFEALFNDVILPRHGSSYALCYECVFKSPHTIGRFLFQKHTQPVTFTFYKANEEKNPLDGICLLKSFIYYSDESITMHIRKVILTKQNRLGYMKAIEEERSRTQDVPIANLLSPSRDLSFLLSIKLIDTPLQRPRVVMQSVFDLSVQWFLQREFIQSSLVTSNDKVHIDNLQACVDFIHGSSQPYQSLLEFVQAFLRHLGTYHGFEYFIDRRFYDDTKEGSDQGNRLIEMTKLGDCEDLNHAYMRGLRTLVSLCQIMDTPHHENIALLTQYIPCFYICDIQQSVELEFHSTMILLPLPSSRENILSIEVTNLTFSMDLGENIDSFTSWHKFHYALEQPFGYYLFKKNANPTTWVKQCKWKML